MSIKEKFFHKFYRQAIKADFRSGDQILSGAFAGVISYVRPKEYVKSNSLQRILEIVWFSFVFLLFGLVVVVVSLGVSTLYGHITGLSVVQALPLAIGVFLLWAYGLYMAMVSLGYLRWMWRNFNK